MRVRVSTSTPVSTSPPAISLLLRRLGILCLALASAAFVPPNAVNGSSYTLASKAKHSQQNDPAYMRIHILGIAESSWADHLDKDHVAAAFPLSDCDIDVSYDRKHWFHLFGKSCIRREPKFNAPTPTNRKSPTPDP